METIGRLIRQTRIRKLLNEVGNVALVRQENQSEILGRWRVYTNIGSVQDLAILRGNRLPIDQFPIILHLQTGESFGLIGLKYRRGPRGNTNKAKTLILGPLDWYGDHRELIVLKNQVFIFIHPQNFVGISRNIRLQETKILLGALRVWIRHFDHPQLIRVEYEVFGGPHSIPESFGPQYGHPYISHVIILPLVCHNRDPTCRKITCQSPEIIWMQAWQKQIPWLRLPEKALLWS